MLCVCSSLCFFFKQKTAYEMRISDWSSDVCSSDLANISRDPPRCLHLFGRQAGCQPVLFVGIRGVDRASGRVNNGNAVAALADRIAVIRSGIEEIGRAHV